MYAAKQNHAQWRIECKIESKKYFALQADHSRVTYVHVKRYIYRADKP